MMAPASFAVVVPLYNHARYVKEALDSVLSQTQAPSEIVLIDDGSSDGGLAVAEAVLGSFPNKQLVRQENRGAHIALNRGIALTGSSHIAILNSDDCFELGKLERCRHLIEADPEIGLIFGGVNMIDDQSRPVTSGDTFDWLRRARKFYSQTNSLRSALVSDNFSTTTSNMVFTKAVWGAVSGFQQLRYCHDLDFILSCFGNSKVHFDDHQQVRYRVHATNTIKENYLAMKFEVACIIAETLHRLDLQELEDDIESGDNESLVEIALRKVEKSELLSLVTARPKFQTRAEFYAWALTSSLRNPRHIVAEGSGSARKQMVSIVRGKLRRSFPLLAHIWRNG